jgi:hypothetical protein
MSLKSETPPEGRKLITRSELEHALAEGVRTGDPECEAFIGVLVERFVPASKVGPNWIVKGIKYGKADRARCGALLAKRVEDAQQQFDLSD